MIDRWVLFYDGGCPLCMKTKSKLPELVGRRFRITAVDLNSDLAKSKGYSNKTVVLETPHGVFKGYHAWLIILSFTKYRWTTIIFLRPAFILFYFLVAKTRKIIGRFL